MASSSSSSSSIYRVLFLFLLLFCLALWIASSSPIEFSHLSRVMEIQHRERESALVQETAVRGLLDRLLPSHSSSFEFEIISKDVCGGKACFSISNHPLVGREGSPEILVRGVSGGEISAGLHWFLKYFCGAHVSWEKTGGAQLFSVPTPGSLHTVPSTGILIQRPIQWSYYQNAVTSSCFMLVDVPQMGSLAPNSGPITYSKFKTFQTTL